MDAIFQTKVTPEILGRVLQAFGEMEPEDRKDMTGRALMVIRILDEEGLLDEEPHLAAAIEFRLEALARLAARPELKAWSIPGDVKGMVRLDPVVLEAAASEPLRDFNNRVAFDPESFFKRLMYISGEAGHG